jgi:hypothetical protein
MANNYTSAEWQAMSADPPPYGAPLPQTGAPAHAPGLATQPNDWTTLRPTPQPHPQTTIGEMRGIMDLFDRLTDVVAQQRSSRIATNSYVLELEKLINKLRDCINRLLALLQECRDNKDELERLRNRIEQHPNLNLIRDQLTDTITEMQNDQLDPDQFRAQLAELVGEIKRICDEVDNMRRAGFGNGGDGDDGDGGGGDGETKGNNDRRVNRGRGGQKRQGDNYRGSFVRSRIAEVERDDSDLPQNDPLRRTQAVSPEISGQGFYGPVGDGGAARRAAASRRGRGSGNQPLGFGSNTGRGLGGGWQTPEKLESLSKSKPIRTLDSIKKKKKAKRGNKSKRRRNKSKRRRNKKKKQTKRKRNKKRKKKRTRKR